MMNIASILLRCPGFFFPFYPLSCALFCFQWPVPMTLLRGLLSGYCSCFAYSLREPEVPPIHILSRTGLNQPSSSTQTWSPESLSRLGKSHRHILCSRSPPVESTPSVSFSVPYPTWSIHFPISPGSTSLQMTWAQILTWSLPLGNPG